MGLFDEKTEGIVAFVGLVSSLVTALIGNIIRSTKEKAQFVTRKELDTKLQDYAKKESLEAVKTDVQEGFDRIEALYHADKRFQHEREMALIKRIDEIVNNK